MAPPTLLNTVGVYLFILVSVCSAAADGSIIEFYAASDTVSQKRAEVLDRYTATIGGAYAVFMFLCKSHSDPWRFLLEIFCLCLCVLPLHFSRVTPLSGHEWRWAWLQCLWHLSSAFTVALACPHFGRVVS